MYNLCRKLLRKPFGESFPSIEILEPERVDPVPAPLQTVVAPKSPVRKPEPQRQSVHSSVQVVAPSVSENKSPNPGLTNKESSFLPATGKKERLVKLGSKSEAKRAFLYSEIFNRKY